MVKIRSEYQLIYKCRLCGEKFEIGAVRTRDIILVKAACQLNYKKTARIDPTDGHCIALTDTHSCKDGSIGIADFCGFRKVKEDPK